MLMEPRLKPLPRGGVLLPTWPPRATQAAIAMHPSCRPRSLTLQRLLHAAAGLLGGAAVPTRARPWRPTDAATWVALSEQWQSLLGPFDGVAASGRYQRSRTGVSVLLLHRGRSLAWVRLREGGSARLERERVLLEGLTAATPSTFATPAVLGAGEHEGWAWLAMEPLPPLVHAPAREPAIGALAEEVQAVLGPLLDRPPGTAPHWVPVHADMSPWNLRRIPRRRRPLLLDWEDATWGPPGADELYHGLTRAALWGEPVPTPVPEEAARWWRGRVEARDAHAADAALVAEMRRLVAVIAP